MGKFKIWDKQEDIFTPGVDPKTGKVQWTAEEYIRTHAPWAAIPQVKVIITNSVINGGVFMEYNAAIEEYKCYGVPIVDGMPEDEVLQLMSNYEDAQTQVVAGPDSQSRIAEALENIAANGLSGEASELLNILLGEE